MELNKIGSIGLIKSTIELYKKINKLNIDYIIILEDDIYFHKNYNDLVEGYLKNKNEYDLI